jgi:hypothetical protein
MPHSFYQKDAIFGTYAVMLTKITQAVVLEQILHANIIYQG